MTGGSGGLKIGPLSLSGSAKVTKEKNERYSYSNKYSFARVDIIKRIKSDMFFILFHILRKESVNRE